MFGKEPLGSNEFDNVKTLRWISEKHRGEPWAKTKNELKRAGVLPQDKTHVDVIVDEILKKVPNYELRREREREDRETVNRNYREQGFTRFGRTPYQVDVVTYLTCEIVEKHLPKDFLEVIEEKRFRGFKFILRQHLKREYGDWKPRRRDKYAAAIFDYEAWNQVLTIPLDDKYPIPLFERAKEATGYTLFDKAKQLRLDKKNGFFLALTVYSIKKMGKVDGCGYLKPEEEIINAFDVPRSTFKLMMTELYKIG